MRTEDLIHKLLDAGDCEVMVCPGRDMLVGVRDFAVSRDGKMCIIFADNMVKATFTRTDNPKAASS